MLDSAYIMTATNALAGKKVFSDTSQVDDALKKCAEQILDDLVLEKVQRNVNDRIVKSVNIGGSSKSGDIAQALGGSISGSFRRLEAVRTDLIDSNYVPTLASEVRTKLAESLEDATWRSEYPGRSILQRFAGEFCGSTASYEGLRNLVVAQMEKDKHCPESMRAKLDAILQTEVPG